MTDKIKYLGVLHIFLVNEKTYVYGKDPQEREALFNLNDSGSLIPFDPVCEECVSVLKALKDSNAYKMLFGVGGKRR